MENWKRYLLVRREHEQNPIKQLKTHLTNIILSCFMTDIIFMSSERLINGIYNNGLTNFETVSSKNKTKRKKNIKQKKQYVFH